MGRNSRLMLLSLSPIQHQSNSSISWLLTLWENLKNRLHQLNQTLSSWSIRLTEKVKCRTPNETRSSLAFKAKSIGFSNATHWKKSTPTPNTWYTSGYRLWQLVPTKSGQKNQDIGNSFYSYPEETIRLVTLLSTKSANRKNDVIQAGLRSKLGVDLEGHWIGSILRSGLGSA